MFPLTITVTKYWVGKNNLPRSAEERKTSLGWLPLLDYFTSLMKSVLRAEGSDVVYFSYKSNDKDFFTPFGGIIQPY